jgi:signal peptidase I
MSDEKNNETTSVSPSENSSNQPEELSTKKKIIQEVKSISIIIFFVLIFRNIFFEPFRIPSGSMIPTLMIGDFILVNKFAYGFKVPFTDWFSDPVYISGPSFPKNGDVVVFKNPKDKDINFIKRVIAVPGDTIEIKDKNIYINDKLVTNTEFDGNAIMKDMDDKFKNNNLKFYHSKLGDSEFTYQVDADNYYKVDFERRTIPKGHFFVMGDNRDYSYDSRFWGLVPIENLKGRAILVWFSMIFPFSEDSAKLRYWRIGTKIQ